MFLKLKGIFHFPEEPLSSEFDEIGDGSESTTTNRDTHLASSW